MPPKYFKTYLFLLTLLLLTSPAQALVEFRGGDQIEDCFKQFDDAQSYRSSLKDCYASHDIEIDDVALENISPNVTEIYEMLGLNREFASTTTSFEMLLGENTISNISSFISNSPEEIYNLHQNILNYQNNGLISPSHANSMIIGGYKSFDPVLLAQAGASQSVTDASSAPASTAAAGAAAGPGTMVVMGLIGTQVSDALASNKKTTTLSINDVTTSDESSANATFTVTVNGQLPEDITVDYATSDVSATAGSDYTSTSGSLSISKGDTSASISVPVLDDSIYEGDETATITLSNISNSSVRLLDASGTLTITEDESAPVVTLAASSNSLAENSGSSITLTASLSQIADEDVTVSIGTSGTSTEGTDYASVSDITISAGSSSGTSTFTPSDDSIYEGDETAIISIDSVSGADATESGTQSETITITENESAPTLSLSTSASSVAENGSALTLTATLSVATDEDVVVTFATSGTATSGTDYAALSLTVSAGDLTGTTSFTPSDDVVYEGDETAIIDVDSVSGGSATESGTQQVTITINENESAPTVTLSSSASSVDENGSALTLTATLSVATTADVTIALSASGSATEGTDYESLSNITVSAGDTTGTTSFTPTDDSVFEGDETATIDIDSVSGGSATESGTQQVTITINENELAPTVSLSSSASSFDEDGSAITLTANMSVATTADVTVTFSTSGTATEGTDYANISNITISAGSTSGTTSLTPTNDTTYEGDESAIIAIDSVSGGSATERGTQSVTLILSEDDNPPTVTLSSSASSIAENAGSSLTLTATLSIATTSDVTVALATSGTSTEGTDYASVSDITISAGSLTGTSSFTPTDDAIYENNETAIISIDSVSGGSATESGSQSTTITITDNESPPTLSINDVTTADESAGNASLTVTLSNAASSDVTVQYSTSSSDAVAGSDYTSASGTLTISAGNTTASLNVAILGDNIYEGDESITVSLSGASLGSNGLTITDPYGVITITDDDAAPVVSLSSSASSVAENGSALTLTATMTTATTADVTIALSASGSATEGSDYSNLSSITVSAGDTTGTTSFTPIDDNTFEGDETATIDISSVSGGSASESGTQQISIIISEDDAGPALSINDVTTTDESAANATFTVTLSPTSSSAVTVNYASSNGTATAGSDYTSTSGSLTFSAGDSSKTISVPILADTIYEGNETATMTLSSVSGATISDATGTLTITDDESAPTVTLSSSASSIAENAGSSLTLTATLSTATTADVTVTLAATGTGTEGTDYSSLSSITISAGSLTGTTTFTPTDDSTYEGNETAIVAIDSVSGGSATENGTQTTTITITENESAPTVSLSTSASSIAENSSSTITVTGTLSGATYEQVSVSLSASGTAASGDYAMLTTLTIAAGATTGTVAFDPADDSVFEVDETAIIDIDSVSGGGASENGSQQETITITNDESAPTVTLASSSSSIAENAGSSLTLTASLSGVTYQDVSVAIATSGTATENTDYSTISDITISAGSTSGTASFTPTDDNTFEGDETAVVAVESVSGGGASESGSQSVSITISEDDAGPSLSINDVTTSNETAANATFTIIMSSTSSSNVTVDYASTDGTATSGSDYTLTSGTATITAGSTSTTFNVPVLADTTDEPDETVTLTLSGASGASISDNTGVLTITDDDDAPSLSIADVSVSEAAGTATMTVALSAASGKDITVAYATTEGTATAGSDYTTTSGTLSITAGNSSGTFTIPITSDSTDEDNETVTLTISSPSNASISDTTAVLTITDDDAAPSLSIADASTSDESAASTSLTVTLSAASGKTITVDYATSDGTATSGSDYTSTSGTLTFSPGDTSKTIDVAVLADTTFEGNETVTVTIENASNASISAATATLTITEDDAGPSLSVNDVSVTEANTTANFTVSMSPASASSVTVDFATTSSDAVSSDYTSTSGSLTFSAGETSKSVNVSVLEDTLDEANETVTLTLSNASGATISDDTGTLTINDDDDQPSLSINDVMVAESAGTGTLRVSLSTASGRGVSFSYATTGGTATSGSDYTTTSGSYTISAGDTYQDIAVSITDDSSEESTTAETIVMTISSASNASISDATGQISINDNDGFNGGTTATYNSGLETTYADLTEYTNIEAFAPNKTTSPNAFESMNLNKALAYEKYGTGKQIAIVDKGYYLTEAGSNYDHYDLNGKSITTFGTFSTPSAGNMHGSQVAGAAAADLGDGGTTGVAPGASLHISDWSTLDGYSDEGAKMAAATNDASTAVVQNNSWQYYNNSASDFQTFYSSNGYSSYYEAMGDYTSTFTSTTAETYVTALNNFQSHGVIVFANGNNTNKSEVSFTSALPSYFSQLAEAWITVANIEKTGTSSFTYTNQGNPCGTMAGPYCLAADGTNVTLPGTVDQSNGTGYHGNTSGTSFSAPFVSGAIALLADHFPNQTPEQWTDRLLASADNNIGFSQIGTVSFGNGVVHGYSAEAGHGMMDIYAALQPITTTRYAASIYAGAQNLSSDQRFNLQNSTARTDASMGDGLASGLGQLENYFYDALGGGFKYDMSKHVRQVAQNAKTIDLDKEFAAFGSPANDNLSFASRLKFDGSVVDGTFDSDAHRFVTTVGSASPAIQSFFEFGANELASYSDYDTPYLTSKEGGAGVSYIGRLGDTRYFISYNKPVQEGPEGNVKGRQTSAVFAAESNITSNASLGVIGGSVAEDDAFLGLEGTEAFTLEGADSRTSFIGSKFGFKPSEDTKVSGMMTFGSSSMSRPDYGILSGAENVKSSSFGLSLEKNNVFGNDTLAVSLSQPNRVDSGSMNVKLTNLSDSEGNLSYTNRSVSIAPSGRQKDLGVSYRRRVSDRLTLSSKLVATRELNHVKSAKDAASAFLGMKYGDFKLGATSSTHRKGFDAKASFAIKF